MKLEYIREFITLAETLNFSKAAEKLFLAQPALSRHIAIIEEEMGGRLFRRDTRNVGLTPAGKAVYEAFREILKQYDGARENVSLLSSGQAGVLRISSPYYWTSDYTEPVVQRFGEEFPQCSVKVLSCQPPDGFTNLMNGKTDLLLAMSIPGFRVNISDDIRVFDFTKERLSAMMPTKHAYAGLDSVKPEQLNNETLVFLEEDIYKSLIDAALTLLARHGARPSAKVYAQQVDTLAYTVKNVGGIAVMPWGVRHMDRDYISFVPIDGDDFIFPMSFYLPLRQHKPAHPPVSEVFRQGFCE